MQSFQRWHITLGVVFLAQLLTTMGFSLIFPFLPLYVEDLGSVTGLSVELMAGLVFSAQAITMMIASPIWGVVADRYGRKLMSMRALFGGAVILTLMGMVTNGEQLILLRAVQGLVTGTVAANNALVAGAVPRERIGFAMGTLQLGLWGGIAVGPLVGGFLADLYGFAMPFFITGAALLVGGVMIYFGVDEDFVPRQSQTEERPGIFAQWQHVLTANGVGMVFSLRFLTTVGRQILMPVAPLFVVVLLPTNATNIAMFTGAILATASATSTFSGVYLGRLGDRIGHRTILIGASVFAMLAHIPMVFVVDVWQLLGLQAVAGIAIGGIISAPSALLAHYTEVGEEGSVYGLDNSVVAAARALAPLIGSAIALTLGLRATFAATALIFLVVTAAAYWLLPSEDRATRPTRLAATGD